MRPNISFHTGVVPLDLTFREEWVTWLGKRKLEISCESWWLPLKMDTIQWHLSSLVREGPDLLNVLFVYSLPKEFPPSPPPPTRKNKQAKTKSLFHKTLFFQIAYITHGTWKHNFSDIGKCASSEASRLSRDTQHAWPYLTQSFIPHPQPPHNWQTGS